MVLLCNNVSHLLGASLESALHMVRLHWSSLGNYISGLELWIYEATSVDPFNTSRLRQNGHRYSEIFKCIFLNGNVWIPIKMSLKFVPKGSINNIPALIPIMAWYQPGNKPLSEPMMVRLLMHICITWPQWVKITCSIDCYIVPTWWL